MKLSNNELKIIKLLSTSDNYLSSYAISNSTGISRRTVRDTIASVKKILASYDIELSSISSKGYIIANKNNNTIRVINKLVDEYENKSINYIPDESAERCSYIITRLIEESNFIKPEVIEQELVISHSTFNNDLRYCKTQLDKNNLKLVHKPKYGLKIDGDELNLRSMLADYLFTNLRSNNMIYDFIQVFISDKNTIEYQIIECIKNNKITISDIGLCDFLVCFTIAFNRMQKGHFLTNNFDTSDIHFRNEFRAGKEMAEIIYKNFNIEIPEAEINSLAIDLICKRRNRNNNLPKDANNELISTLVNRITQVIYDETMIRFNSNVYHNDLSYKIYTTLIRYRFNRKLRSNYYSNINDIYPLAYQVALIAKNIIFEATGIPLSRSEMVSYTVFFNNNINIYQNKKLNTLLIIGQEFTFGHNCINNIVANFEHELNLSKHIAFHELSSLNVNDYDFIISTSFAHGIEFPVPVVYISPLGNSDDMENIRSSINAFFHEYKPEIMFDYSMYFHNVQGKDISAISKYIYEQVENKLSISKISFHKIFKDFSRNKYEYLNNGIVLLKTKELLSHNDSILVIHLENEIEFNNNPAKLIVIMSYFDEAINTFNYIKNSLTAFSNNEKLINDYRENPTYTAFLKSFMG